VAAALADYFGHAEPGSTRPVWPKSDPNALRGRLDRLMLEDGSLAALLLIRGHLAELAGARERADRDLDLYLEICGADTAVNRKNMHLAHLGRAMVYAARQPKRAMAELEAIDVDSLERVVDEVEIAGWLSVGLAFRPLQGTPRYRAFLDRYPPRH
jgi:hypothetical protein